MKMAQGGTADGRAFLFLQGPHGPFFWQLARQLQRTGARCLRVGFNAGDKAFWPERRSYIPFRDGIDRWPDRLRDLIAANGITDLVLYGDIRRVHAVAIDHAIAQGLRVHIFEEGYLRPYWITYERGGSNGNSRLMTQSIQSMQALIDSGAIDAPVPPGHWGDMRQHVIYGALYHWFVLFRNKSYPNFRPHRSLTVGEEFRLYLKRLTFMPFQAAERIVASRRIRRDSFPYHLVLLQLAHDSAFEAHGEFATQEAFLDHVIKGFKEGAPAHHHLVFKAHPLEDGRTPLRRMVRRLALAYGLPGRVHYVLGGKLAGLLNDARSAVTVNSTSGQQALWRGLPLRCFGSAVYAKPELVSRQPIAAFFRDPHPPDIQAYRDFRSYLLATSQLPGSFYAAKGRKQAIRRVTDMMLSTHDPYDLVARESEAQRQQLKLVV